MNNWNDLYIKIGLNRIPVIKCLDGYYMIYGDEVTRCNEDVRKRYNCYFESDESTYSNQAKIDKLRSGVRFSYELDNLVWYDLKEFLGQLSNDSIDIINNSCDETIKLLKDIYLERPTFGALNGYRIRVIWINKEEDNIYKLNIQAESEIYKKISQIPPIMGVNLIINNIIDWKINVIKHGILKTIEADVAGFDGQTTQGKILIRVIG